MTITSVPTPPRLRDDIESLTALVQRAADALNIDQAFVEKDFWVTELLRAVARGAVVEINNRQELVTVVFKGGTSLSRVYHLTERFSEDVDILLNFPEGASTGARDRALKAIVDRSREHLGLNLDQCILVTSTKGIKRNVEFHYPRQFASNVTRESVLLEMGSRGGSDPHESRILRSLVAEFAITQRGEPVDLWEEFVGVVIPVLRPERTLLEKCALLHNVAVRFADGDPAAIEEMGKAGRHYYDVACLLRDPGIRLRLGAMGSPGVIALSADINDESEKARWRSLPRPAAGFGASPAFDPDAQCQEVARAGFQVALRMVHGPRPTYVDCLSIIRDHATLL
jgi:hypothetical protein